MSLRRQRRELLKIARSITRHGMFALHVRDLSSDGVVVDAVICVGSRARPVPVLNVWHDEVHTDWNASTEILLLEEDDILRWTTWEKVATGLTGTGDTSSSSARRAHDLIRRGRSRSTLIEHLPRAEATAICARLVSSKFKVGEEVTSDRKPTWKHR